jgi:hypothetical protein
MWQNEPLSRDHPNFAAFISKPRIAELIAFGIEELKRHGSSVFPVEDRILYAGDDNSDSMDSSSKACPLNSAFLS